jgi:hypothetical protein
MPRRPPELTATNLKELRLQVNQSFSEVCEAIEEILGIDDKQFTSQNTINMNEKKIVNLSTPTAATDAVPKDYVDVLVNVFQTVSCPDGTNPVADGPTDTLSLLAATDMISITGDAETDSVTLGIDLQPDSDELSAGVTMTNVDTFYDGPKLTLGVGKWMIIATSTIQGTDNTDMFVTSKLWNGTAVSSSTESALLKMGAAVKGIISHTLCAIVEITTGTEDWLMSSAATAAGFSILEAAADNGAGDNASSIRAVQIG